jgi:alanyl-tRNA synthetase
MKSDKEIKKEFKKKASEDPDSYYATDVLRKYGFTRKKCTTCGLFFWTVEPDREVCGDSACSGGFRLFENNPCKRSLSYIEVWQEFSKMFEGLGYTPINRYPVVARWNPTADFVMASIAAFQPYVISGEVDPPARRLVIPQFSIRFSDIENIGITASHNTGFVMIGQHMFVQPEEWNQDKCFEDILKWLRDGLGLAFEELTFHEDAWAGGGNFGPCMEYFSRGVELGNQVYMMFEQTPKGPKELKLKVLDMGMGMERNAWFSQATPTQHQAIYPRVIERLLERTGIELDPFLMKRFIPLSGMLNIDEVDDIDAAWKQVAEKLEMDTKELQEKVLPLSGVFSIADHCRTLLFALCDGALPSNVGGGYNLRMLVRRALSFIDKFDWNIRLKEVCAWHAEELEPIFPELKDSIDSVGKILDVEREKYEATKKNSQSIVERLLKSGQSITEKKLLELYDSNGIPPQMIIAEAKKKEIDIDMPQNFFGKVAELHEKQEQVHATQKEDALELDDIQDTEALYFDDYKKIEFDAKVIKVIDNKVILDKTAFYPTSGGQIHDIGTLDGAKVRDVFKQNTIIVHELEKTPSFSEGDIVTGNIDIDWRRQLTQHHTATHIVNGAARKILGPHINQAGAKKTDEKAHLDITHYQGINDAELKEIEDLANEIIKKDIPIISQFLPRSDAEKKYGMGIYQGGAVPGKKLRIVAIEGIDIEACAGTHLNRTSEVDSIKIEKATKIQDGIVRLVFTAGAKAEESSAGASSVLTETAAFLDCSEAQIPGRCDELFSKWKKAKKNCKKKKRLPKDAFVLSSTEEYLGDVLSKTVEILRTQPEHILKTIKRFMEELEFCRKQNETFPEPEN